MLTTEFARHDLAQNSNSPTESDRVRVIREGVASYLPDIDGEETAEWLESFDELLSRSGPAGLAICCCGCSSAPVSSGSPSRR